VNIDPMAGRKKKTRSTRSEVGNGMEKAMKQKALTPEDAVNRLIRPKASNNQSTGITRKSCIVFYVPLYRPDDGYKIAETCSLL